MESLWDSPKVFPKGIRLKSGKTKERRLQAAATLPNMPLPRERSVPIPRHSEYRENLPDAHEEKLGDFLRLRAPSSSLLSPR